MKALLLLSVLISLSSPALARIGETREQCEARYGKPVDSVNENITIHKKNGLEVWCSFFEGRCYLISFRKIEADSTQKKLPLSDTEKAALMEANSNGNTWVQTRRTEDGNKTFWQNGDLEASYSIEPMNTLSVINVRSRDARLQAIKNGSLKASEKAAQEKSKLKDF